MACFTRPARWQSGLFGVPGPGFLLKMTDDRWLMADESTQPFPWGTGGRPPIMTVRSDDGLGFVRSIEQFAIQQATANNTCMYDFMAIGGRAA